MNNSSRFKFALSNFEFTLSIVACDDDGLFEYISGITFATTQGPDPFGRQEEDRVTSELQNAKSDLC